jgi:MFS family permease
MDVMAGISERTDATDTAGDPAQPADPSALRVKLYRRSLAVVVVSQVFGGSGLAAGATVGALLAQDMLGTDRAAGVPTALFTVGSAGAAYVVGRLAQRYGRRPGLTVGYLAGGVGALGVVLAALTDQTWLLFISLFLYGAGNAANLQARYAGTDLADARQRGTAVSIALVCTTVGAVAGPNLVGAMGRIGEAVGIPPLAGPFLLSTAAYGLAGIILAVFLRPDPLVLSRAWASARPARTGSHEPADGESPAADAAGRAGGIKAGATVIVLAQFVMVAIMTMTPIHMAHHGLGLREVGLVISLHVGAMYLPSLITGVLVDRIGRSAMAVASGVTLLGAGVLSALAADGSPALLTAALILLGLGWNFGLISGTAMLVDATAPAERAKTQGAADVLVALAGASGGALSGIVAASTSYSHLALAGGLCSLLLIPVTIRYGDLRRRTGKKPRDRGFRG